MLPEVSCIIIDDELKAVELLKERLKTLFPNVIVKESFTDWKLGYQKLQSSKIDLLFLDISMPEKSGIDFLKLFTNPSFQVIFTTAHTEFAIEAIKLSAVGYVLKPIDDYELSFAVNKVLNKIQSAQQKDAGKLKANEANPLKIGIPNIKGVDYLNMNDILYFESVNKYTKIVTEGYSVLSSYNLGEFKKLVDLSYFFQTHRSYIANLYKVKRYETAGYLVMEDNMEIPVSRSLRTEFLAIFNQISRVAGPKK